ncbi:MAG: glycosyltransferase [Xanthomonadaceae bacterium]|nr:glycosyltransferase [Xanthomonadaceae bacterium]
MDQERALKFFSISSETGVANIPVDTCYFSPPPEGWNRNNDNIVLFTGHLSHPPNIDAVLYFLKEIWPLILKQLPDAIFQIVGMLPADDLVLAAQNAPRCELHANVPDIRPYFWNASVYVVPMRYGGGIRQKIFEAWSTCTPIVCTTMAAEGTGAEYGIHCFLEDTPQDFSEKVVEILRNKKSSESIIRNAKSYVDSTYSVSAVAPKFQHLVQRSIAIKKQKPFKMLFDLRWMQLGHAGGIEQATYELVSAISQIDYKNAYRIMAPRSACCEWSFPKEFQMKFFYSDNVETELETKRSLLINGLASSFGVSQLMNTAMRNLSLFHKLDFDIVHSVAGYTHPDVIGFPNILTINDLQHLHYPQFFTEAEYKERENLYRTSAERAEHIICISEFTRQDVHRLYGIPLEKMSTVWIIPSRNVWVKVSRSDVKSTLSRLGLSTPFLFFPAHCWPHKNHARLVEAFVKVLAKLPDNLRLVLTGRPFPDDHPAAVLIREAKLGNRISHLGYRSPLEIRILFQECAALVFPSLFEGYGMPVAEAIIAGKPVLCSNVTSLPEIAGNAAFTFDPTDIDTIGDALVQVTTSEKLRSELSAAALSRRGFFGARRHAVQTLSIYNRVYNELYGVGQ